MNKSGQKSRNMWRGLAVGLVWLFLWTLAACMMGKPLLLPGPLDTLAALKRLAVQASFWQSVGLSVFRVMTGYVCAVVLGVCLAFLCHFVSLADAFLSPMRTVIRTTPVTSFIILVLLWLSDDATPAFISFLMVLPIIWTNVQEGLAHTDMQLLEMTRCYRFGAFKTLVHLYIPSVLPHFASACANGLGFAWKSGIAAEVIAKPMLSIGKNLQDAKVYLETPSLFAWTLVVILLSLLLEKLLKYALHRINAGKGGKAA